MRRPRSLAPAGHRFASRTVIAVPERGATLSERGAPPPCEPAPRCTNVRARSVPPQGRHPMRKHFMTRAPLASAALLSILALATGCTDSSRVLARVGNRTLTVDDFVDAAADKVSHYPGPPDTSKA